MPFPPIFPPTKASLADRIDQGRGVVPADLVLKGGRVFDLVTGELVETDVAICGDTIVGVFCQYQGRREVEEARRQVESPPPDDLARPAHQQRHAQRHDGRRRGPIVRSTHRVINRAA
jgi:hypothetical protein